MKGDQEALEVLAVRAGAVIDRVLASARRETVRNHAADIRSTVLLRLLPHLQRIVPAASAIEDFDAFVAVATQNAINDHLRQLFPERAKLKNRVRYLLAHSPALALWHSQGGLLAGLREWEGSTRASALPVAGDLPAEALRRDDDRTAMAAVFARAGGPILLDDLVDLLAAAWHVEAERPPERGADVETTFGQHDELRTLWREVGLLSPPQRTALLLNLRDAAGGTALPLVIILGIAGFDDVAAAAGLTPERLTEIWSELPLDDNAIAALLGVTRQQVINFRSGGRRRLMRRMEARARGGHNQRPARS